MADQLKSDMNIVVGRNLQVLLARHTHNQQQRLRRTRLSKMGKKSKKGQSRSAKNKSNNNKKRTTSAKLPQKDEDAVATAAIPADTFNKENNEKDIATDAPAVVTPTDEESKSNATETAAAVEETTPAVEEAEATAVEETQEERKLESIPAVVTEQESVKEVDLPSPAVVSVDGDVAEADDLAKNEDVVDEKEPTVEPNVVVEDAPVVKDEEPTTTKEADVAVSAERDEKKTTDKIFANRIRDVLDEDKAVFDVTPVKQRSNRSIPMLDTPDAKELEQKQECGCRLQ